jgi:hypothetical protein
MRSRRLSSRILAACIAGAALLGVGAGCSSSDETSATTTTTTTAAPATSTTVDQASSGSVDCAAVQSALTTISTVEGQATAEGDAFDLVQFEADIPQLQAQAEVIEQQAQTAGAPAEALELYTQRNTAVIDLLVQLGETRNQQEFQTQYQALQTPEYDDATQQVGAALKAQCPSLTD